MTLNLTNVSFNSNKSSNKVLLQGAGNFTIPLLPGAGENFGSIAIPHGFASDNLLFQVSIVCNTIGALIPPHILPWNSNDNRISIYGFIDSTNLTIVGVHNDSGGGGDPLRVIQYFYRILIP